MERQIKTKGIVLRRINLHEADQIVTVLSQTEGKISLLAKGSRRLKSKFCGRLEPFYEGHFDYFQGRDLGHLNEVELLCPGPDKLDLKSKSILFYMAEATMKLVADRQECEAVYLLLQDALAHFEKEQSEVMLYGYLVRLLTELGFMAPWNQNSETDLKLDLSKPYFLCLQDGSIAHAGFAGATDIRLTPSIIKWVSYMQTEDFAALKKVTPSRGEKAEVFFVLKSVLNGLFSKPFKSEEFFYSLG